MSHRPGECGRVRRVRRVLPSVRRRWPGGSVSRPDVGRRDVAAHGDAAFPASRAREAARRSTTSRRVRCGGVLRSRFLDRAGALLRPHRDANALHAATPTGPDGRAPDQLVHRSADASSSTVGRRRRRRRFRPGHVQRDRSLLADRPYGETRATLLVRVRMDRARARRRSAGHRSPSGQRRSRAFLVATVLGRRDRGPLPPSLRRQTPSL